MSDQLYLWRFFNKLLVEIEEFLTGQQMITAFVLALVALFLPILAGQTNARRREMIAEVEAYQPTITSCGGTWDLLALALTSRPLSSPRVRPSGSSDRPRTASGS
jgi:hypothetical protein